MKSTRTILGCFLALQVLHSSINGFMTTSKLAIRSHCFSNAVDPLFSSNSDKDSAGTVTTTGSNNNSKFKTPMAQESAASVFSGAGPAQVDMNQYNLASLDEIVDQWTAQLTAATPLLEAGIYLGARNKREIMVDIVKVVVQRQAGQGLGIELLELAGGREDGVGITIVSGLVEGGVCADSGIIPGDSIVQIQIASQIENNSNNDSFGMSETQKTFAINTECLNYDATVDAIRSVPSPPENGTDTAIITLKRLRRKPKVNLKLQYPPSMNEPDMTLELFAGENLRRSMLVKGVKLNDPLSKRFDTGASGDCGAEGTCATCVVAIVRGGDLLNKQKVHEEQLLRKNPRWRLACKTIVGYGMKEGDLVVRVNPRQW